MEMEPSAVVRYPEVKSTNSPVPLNVQRKLVAPGLDSTWHSTSLVNPLAPPYEFFCSGRQTGLSVEDNNKKSNQFTTKQNPSNWISKPLNTLKGNQQCREYKVYILLAPYFSTFIKMIKRKHKKKKDSQERTRGWTSLKLVGRFSSGWRVSRWTED